MNINLKQYKKYIIPAVAFLIVAAAFAFYKFNQDKSTATEEKPLKEVSVQTVADSRQITQELKLPAIVSPDQQAQIFAKIGGTVKEIKFNINDTVNIGDAVVVIDDLNSGSGNAASLSSTQVKQAKLAVEQAATSYNLAKTNYYNLLASSEKDLNQAGIARDQALTGRENLTVTVAEALKTAESSYATAKIAAEQAKVNLENARSSAVQSQSDVQTNAGLAADTAVNTSGSVIVAINNITGLDENLDVGIAYKSNLGALNFDSVNKAKKSYATAKEYYANYQSSHFDSVSSKLEAAVKLVESAKILADDVKTMFDNTITSSVLPQSSLTGVSLSSLQSTAAGYQSQMAAALNQMNAAKQGLANVNLSTNSSIENLEKVYSLAKQQEATAKQNLESLKAQNKTQLDNAGFGADAAGNQYDSAEIKLNSQIALAKSQMDLAELSYRNAALNLQNLYDAHILISPIKGKMIRKAVSVGDTVAAGQLLAVVGAPEKIKLQIYVDKDSLDYIKINQSAKITDNENNSYDGLVSLVSMQADPLTKRFLVEVIIKNSGEKSLTLGTVVNVSLALTKTVDTDQAIILPLSALGIGQNENFIFMLENEIAKKKAIEIIKIEGETAQIKVEQPAETLIVIDGNKNINDGEKVRIVK